MSQSLPVTSYIKMIDIWMLFTMTIPFLEVVGHTTKEVLKDHDCGPDGRLGVIKVKPDDKELEEEEDEITKKKSSSLARLVCRFLLPIGSLIFSVTFWVVGLVKSYSTADLQPSNLSDCLINDLN